MSSSGISATNSGPLAIRTYNSGSNKTFVLTDYDIPVPPNYVLITSSNGLLVPTNSPSISSIQVSSIRDRDGFTGDNGEVLHTNGSTIYWGPSGAGTGYWTENGSIIYNNNGGFVGIGTSNPGYTLDVAGSVYINDMLQISTSSGNGALRIISQDGNTYIESGNNFNTGSGNALYFTNIDAMITTMVIDTNIGKVGIGTTTPQDTLDVNGSIALTSANIELLRLTTSFGNSYIESGNALYFTNIGAITTTMVIDTNIGNIGIGTNSPQAKLDVAGRVRVAQGTAGAPAIYFSSDSDTGLYGIGNGQMGISANGAPRMLITNTDVTISPNPGNNCIVSNLSNNNATVMAINNTGTASTVSLLRLNTGNGGYGLYATQSEASASGYETAPSTFQIYSYYPNANNVLTIYPNGSTIINGNLSVNGTINATQLSNTITDLQSQTAPGTNITYNSAISLSAGRYQLQLCVLDMVATGNFLNFFCANPATPTDPINYSANQVDPDAVGYKLCMNSGYFQHSGGNLQIILNTVDSSGIIQTPWTGTWSLQLVKIL